MVQLLLSSDHLSIQGKARLWTWGNYSPVVKKSPSNVVVYLKMMKALVK